MREEEAYQEARGKKRKEQRAKRQELEQELKDLPGLPMRIIRCFTRYPRVSILSKRHQAPPWFIRDLDYLDLELPGATWTRLTWRSKSRPNPAPPVDIGVYYRGTLNPRGLVLDVNHLFQTLEIDTAKHRQVWFLGRKKKVETLGGVFRVNLDILPIPLLSTTSTTPIPLTSRGCIAPRHTLTREMVTR